ncbi:O-antigen ligase [Aureimonas sp. ME7]|uniref:O-antigen ligase family protein n=1 Tax=Aureimonas sp. ME7 TaxID=2744252 RepID=UPI0015F4F593|nr:O-antigen ligase [Aureimonas sp. ME7]
MTAIAVTGPQSAAVRTVLAAVIMALLFVTFEPYQSVFTGPEGSGNVVNQLGYGGLGILSLLIHACVTPKSVVAGLLRPAWLLMAGLLFLSSFQSIWPEASLRAVVFSLAAMLAMTAALCLPPDERAFRRMLAFAALAVLALSYGGVALLPSAAIHNEALEGQNIGLWRGIYSHKNVAGPVMAILCLMGLYLMRCGQRWLGASIAVASIVFVLQTGSKTTAALLPFVTLLVVFGRAFGGRRLPVLVLAATLAVMGTMTLGAALSPLLYDLLQWALPGTTFTGRLDLWRFAVDVLGNRIWTGAGFEAFWTTPAVMQTEPSMELSWDPRGIVNAHNGYLDLVIAMGLPGLALGLGMLVVLPFSDFARIDQPTEAESRLADFFLMVLSFTLLNAFLESFLFARGNPVWMATWMSIVGLRLLARRGKARDAPARDPAARHPQAPDPIEIAHRSFAR